MDAIINLEEATAWLRGTSDSASWAERRDLARSVVESLAVGPASNGGLALLKELAGDAKWEVRREVAEGLLYVSDSDFFHLAGQLANDTNNFVRRAAERAIDRRRQIAKQAGAARRTVDEIKRQVDLLEKNAGPAAAARAWRICDRYGELVVGSMVHDLRSILTYLKSHCQALIDEGNKRRKSATRVVSDLDFLGRTINDMESFTQPVPTERHQERLADLVRVAADLAEENATQCSSDLSHIELHLDVPDSITLDVARYGLVMALANVIKNALEACAVNAADRAGEVLVEASARDGSIEMRIRDNGIGMSDEEKQSCSLFVPGRRNKTKPFSTGYGLPIAVRHVAAHGGSLTLESQEDVGTNVTITLSLNHDETDHEHEGAGCRG